MAVDDLRDPADRFPPGVIAGREKFFSATSLIPAEMADFWGDDKVSVLAFLVRHDSFDRHKNLCEHPQRRAWSVHKAGTVTANVNANYNVRTQSPGFIYGKICHQPAVNQQTPFVILNGGVQNRQAVAGANREGNV